LRWGNQFGGVVECVGARHAVPLHRIMSWQLDTFFIRSVYCHCFKWPSSRFVFDFLSLGIDA